MLTSVLVLGVVVIAELGTLIAQKKRSNDLLQSLSIDVQSMHEEISNQERRIRKVK